LRGDQEFAREYGTGWATAQSFFGGDPRHVGIIVFLRNVGQDEITRAGIEAFGIAQKFADRMIGEMTGARQNPLFDDPGIGADFQHIQIVIGLKNQAIGFAQMHFNEFRHVAQIGADSYLGAIGPEGKTNGVGGIVRNSESVNVDIADTEALASLDGFGALQPLAEGLRKDALQRIHSGRGYVQRRLPKSERLGQTVAVIGVLVSDQDGIEVVKIRADSSETSKSFAFSEADVYEDAGAFGFEQSQIARTAGRKYGDAQADRNSPEKSAKRLKLFR
jgi:hypothetical protein